MFIGACDDDVVIFTRNTTDALNLLAAAAPGPAVYLDIEHRPRSAGRDPRPGTRAARPTCSGRWPWREACRALSALPQGAGQAHEQALTSRLRDGLTALGTTVHRIWPDAPDSVGIISDRLVTAIRAFLDRGPSWAYEQTGGAWGPALDPRPVAGPLVASPCGGW